MVVPQAGVRGYVGTWVERWCQAVKSELPAKPHRAAGRMLSTLSRIEPPSDATASACRRRALAALSARACAGDDWVVGQRIVNLAISSPTYPPFPYLSHTPYTSYTPYASYLPACPLARVHLHPTPSLHR